MIQILSDPSVIVFIGASLAAIGAFMNTKATQRAAEISKNEQRVFQEKLDSKNAEISELNREIQKSITGGDSFPEITPAFTSEENFGLQISNLGKYPLYDLQVTILDVGLFSKLVEKSKDEKLDIVRIYQEANHVINVGNLGSNQTRMLMNFNLPKEIDKDFLITMVARNGQVNEDLKIRWVDNRRTIAYEIYNTDGLLKKDIPANFPEVHW